MRTLLLALCLLVAQTGEPRSLLDLRALEGAGLTLELIERYRPTVAPEGSFASSGEALATVSRALFSVGREAEAGALLAGARVPSEGLAAVALERARQAMQQDRLEDALELLLVRGTDSKGAERSRSRYGDAPESWLLFARIHARRADLPRATASAERFLELAPRHPEAAAAWHVRARAALQARESEQARLYLAKAEELRRWHELLKVRRIQIVRAPKDPLPRLGLALLFMEAKDFATAERHLTQLTTAHPGFARGWFHLGEAARARGDEAGARAGYDRALREDPEHAPSRFNRALLETGAGRHDRARADLEHLLAGPAAGDPHYLEAHLVLARSLRALGEDAAAEVRLRLYREHGGTQAP